jgi:exodeoxyribonuclease-3
MSLLEFMSSPDLIYNINYHNLSVQDMDSCNDGDKTMRIACWNVRGIRTNILRSGKALKLDVPINWLDEGIGLGDLIKQVQPDIICLQETKLSLDNWELINIPGWRVFASESEGDKSRSANRYSGTAILLADHVPYPISVLGSFPGLSKVEGRVNVIEFDDYYVVNLYVPNSGTNAKYRTEEWNPALRIFLSLLPKPVLLCGDFNVARNIYDLSKTKSKYLSNNDAGLTDEYYARKNQSNFRTDERLWIDQILSDGFVDVWRALNPDGKWDGYTYLDDISKRKVLRDGKWDGVSFTGGEWRRIDYFFVKGVKVKEMVVMPYNGLSSDHLPIVMDYCV